MADNCQGLQACCHDNRGALLPLSPSLCLFNAHTHTVTRSLSVSVVHTHTHAHSQAHRHIYSITVESALRWDLCSATGSRRKYRNHSTERRDTPHLHICFGWWVPADRLLFVYMLHPFTNLFKIHLEALQMASFRLVVLVRGGGGYFFYLVAASCFLSLILRIGWKLSW